MKYKEDTKPLDFQSNESSVNENKKNIREVKFKLHTHVSIMDL